MGVLPYFSKDRKWGIPPHSKPNIAAAEIGMCSTLFDLQIPGNALHENGLQRRKSAGTLVSSQERRAAVVPVINRWSTAGFVPPPV